MAYEKGTKIRVDITGRVSDTIVKREKPGDLLNTTIEIEQTDKGGFFHFLYPASGSVTFPTPREGGIENGDAVSARFDAVVTGEYRGSRYFTTEVEETRDGQGSGFTHYLFLESEAVTVLEETPVAEQPEPEPASEPVRAFAKGDRVRVAIDGVISGQADYTRSVTTTVTETGGQKRNHFLFLNSDLVKVAGDSREAGAKVSARFDAEVTGDYKQGDRVTTRVTELRRTADGEEYSGYLHYLYLDSDAVTLLPSEPEPVPYTTTAAKIGDKIRVDITATLISDEQPPSRVYTQEARETETGITHFFFLGSSSGVTGDKNPGGTVRAQFNAVVIGKPGEGGRSTTRIAVDELERGLAGNSHFVLLDSPGVTLREKPESQPALEEARKLAGLEWNPEAVPVVQQTVGGDRITPAAVEIESADILKRIAELEDGAPPAFRLSRNRSKGQLTPVFASVTAAYAYLDEEDLNPERFTVQEVKGELAGDDQKELDELRKLSEAGRSQFGSSQWITAGVLLRRDDDCDADWARDEAVARLGLGSRYPLDDWPLSQIYDWNEAASNLLESEYLTVDFDGTTYWGKNTG